MPAWTPAFAWRGASRAGSLRPAGVTKTYGADFSGAISPVFQVAGACDKVFAGFYLVELGEELARLVLVAGIPPEKTGHNEVGRNLQDLRAIRRQRWSQHKLEQMHNRQILRQVLSVTSR